MRTVELELCDEYNNDSDTCKSCKLGFYINDAGNKCLPYPSGVPNCRVYTDDTTCTGCITNFYL